MPWTIEIAIVVQIYAVVERSQDRLPLSLETGQDDFERYVILGNRRLDGDSPTHALIYVVFKFFSYFKRNLANCA